MTRQSTAKDTGLTQLITDAIDKGADTAEEIHRAVLDLPVTVLDGLGLEDTASTVKRAQDISLGAIYEIIHDINHKVADLAEELLEQRKEKGK